MSKSRSLVSSWRLLSIVPVFAAGYVFGTLGMFTPHLANAQQQEDKYSETAMERLRAMLASTQAAAVTLEQEGELKPASKGINSFATSVGGLDAMTDLERFQRVDPETFAALYAGMASDEIALDVGRDENGRLTYKGKVVRMYSVERLRELFQKRDRLANPEDL